MKAINEPTTSECKNAWGQYHIVTRQRFEIEKDDIGKVNRDYMGQNHEDYTYRHNDVSRILEKYWDNRGWKWWCFV